ncbi:hypothetical protein SAMN05421812_110135 [Asanoa hainanensis]|uniref:Uncharacterized protein n=1 Tax=Asanoa hainanensis TaxID=560556 RepID=A0A239NRP3_9ACTN|nr:hypothetical protein SAMN05421812_110135 [Asanoa hainanensis]
MAGKVLVCFAAWKKFVSLYPAPRASAGNEKGPRPTDGAPFGSTQPSR